MKSRLADDYRLFATTHLSSLGKAVPAGLPAQLEDVRAILVAYDTARESVDNDGNLTANGKALAMKAAYVAAQTAVDKWKAGKVDGLDKQLTAQRAALLAQADKMLPVPTELQVQNMVRRLSGFDALEVEVLYFDAEDSERRIIEEAAVAIGRQPIRRGDQLVWEPILASDRVVAERTARAERLIPAQATALSDLQRIRNTYEATGGAAKGLLSASLPTHLVRESAEVPTP